MIEKKDFNLYIENKKDYENILKEFNLKHRNIKDSVQKFEWNISDIIEDKFHYLIDDGEYYFTTTLDINEQVIHVSVVEKDSYWGDSILKHFIIPFSEAPDLFRTDDPHDIEKFIVEM